MAQHEAEDKKKVLVIDDEPVILTYLTTVLEDHGYEAISAEDAEAGVRAIHEHRPDLICLDIMMPKRSGVALYVDLKRDRATCGIPIMFVSAFNHLHDLRDPVLFRKMVHDEKVPRPAACVEKPVKVDEFVQTVAACLRESRERTKGKI